MGVGVAGVAVGATVAVGSGAGVAEGAGGMTTVAVGEASGSSPPLLQAAARSAIAMHMHATVRAVLHRIAVEGTTHFM